MVRGDGPGGGGLEHDDAIYPDAVTLSAAPGEAFPVLAHDDGAYPSSPLLAQVGSVALPAAEDADLGAAGGEPTGSAR